MRRIIGEAAELEAAYARDTMPNGLLGLPAELCGTTCASSPTAAACSSGVGPIGPTENPFPRMSETIEPRKERNILETRVTEYQTGEESSWAWGS